MKENKLEKIKILQTAINTLKSEFVGLDSIIDELKLSITPWWVTPEIIKRPVVVSLWGMTGTGKSSVVRRLLELLDLKERALIFDCGQENNDSGTDISGKISEFLKLENKDNSSDSDSKNMVFVFDEFQYARTLSDSGEELSKPALRPIWNIIDDGVLRISEYSYEVGSFLSYFEDLKVFTKNHPGIKIKNLIIEDRNNVKDILEALGYFYFKRSVPGLMESSCSTYSLDDDVDFIPVAEGEEREGKKYEDPYKPLKIIEDKVLRLVIRKINLYEYRPGNEIIQEALKLETLDELVDWLESKKSKIMSTRKIDCSDSLVFIIGNLDEAFHVEGDLSPDFEADIFYDETSKVSIGDIKNALKSRFRAEQISRFGNNIIKYPTLKKIHFEEIIKREVSRICSEFKDSSGIKLKCTNDFLDLLYSEGVYPVQGVRPVFTTIGTIFTPLLSDILIHNATNPELTEAIIEVEDPGSGYKKSRKNIKIKYSEETADIVNLKLTLGELRCPENRKTRFISAVHETGHAILLSYLTGIIPTSIVAVSTDRGGFCTTYDPSKVGEIDSKLDVQNDVMISMAGYCAEELIYGPDSKRTLLGSGSDIESAWDTLSEAAYKLGYFEPFSYITREVLSCGTGIPQGLDSRDTLDQKIKTEFDILKHKTVEILKSNIVLLKKFALELGEKGSLGGDTFYEYIKNLENQNTLGTKRLEEAREENSSNWYKEKLEGS